MVSLKTLVNSSVPGGLAEEKNPPEPDDNRMPRSAVDPYGLIYRPNDLETNEPVDPQDILYTVPDSNFSGETLQDDPHLAPLKAGIIAIEEKIEGAPEEGPPNGPPEDQETSEDQEQPAEGETSPEGEEAASAEENYLA